MTLKALVLAAVAAVIPVGASASLEGTHVHGLAFDPVNAARLLVATHHGLFQIEGKRVEPVSERRDDFMGFSVHPGGDAYFASGHPAEGGNLGVIVSRDGGRTWEPLAPGHSGPVDFHQMDVSLIDPQLMIGLYGSVQVSRDGGRTWAVAGEPPARTFGVTLSGDDAETIYAATESGLYVSRDLGRKWERLDAIKSPVTMVETGADGTLYVYDILNGLTRFDPSTKSFEKIAPPMATDAMLHLAARDGEMVTATHRGDLLKSEDGGATWSPLLD